MISSLLECESQNPPFYKSLHRLASPSPSSSSSIDSLELQSESVRSESPPKGGSRVWSSQFESFHL
ncbi:unnamed protein product [Rhodiola kirilowii]